MSYGTRDQANYPSEGQRIFLFLCTSDNNHSNICQVGHHNVEAYIKRQTDVNINVQMT